MSNKVQGTTPQKLVDDLDIAHKAPEEEVQLTTEKGSIMEFITDKLTDASKEPSEFEVHCMDIFLQFDNFNDGYLTKADLLIFYDDIKASIDGDEKKTVKLENFKE
jgi:hypothetical protein